MLTMVLAIALLGQAADEKPAVKLTPLQQNVADAVVRVGEIQKTLREVNMTPKERLKVRKSLARAIGKVETAKAALIADAQQRAEQAFAQQMMPIWLEQQRMGIIFDIEATKARAMQQMAITAEAARRQELWLQWVRNGIMADEAASLRRMASP